MATLKELPIGIQTFRDVIENKYLYIDKTQLIYDLLRRSKGAFFLSRPRRFGKSLLFSTLGEILEGNRELFEGLWIGQSDYSWESHPVIRLDFGQYPVQSAEELKDTLRWLLRSTAEKNAVFLEGNFIPILFTQLVRQLSKTQGKVAILIDEYDKPLVDNIDNIEEARKIQTVLKNFYTVIKSLDAYLHLVFLTGISKFTRVGVFSGLNNLRDLSLEPKFSSLLGITEAEIERDLAQHVAHFANAREQTVEEVRVALRYWYNGFCFSNNCERVYNPFSLFSALTTYQIAPYWFETGTPTFLIKLLKRQSIAPVDLENPLVSSFAFSTYDIESLDLLPILYQAGYLTIKGYNAQFRRYQLGSPNHEVGQAFNTYLLKALTPLSLPETDNALVDLTQALLGDDLEAFFEILNRFLAEIPYDIQLKKEKYYQSVFFLIFKLIGIHIEVEQRTNRGRIDAVVVTEESVYIFEFKLDGSAEEAIAQIKERDYPAKYRGRGKLIQLFGVNFSTELREIAEWQRETIATQ